MKLISLIINNLTNKVIKKTIKKLSILKKFVYLYHQTNKETMKNSKILIGGQALRQLGSSRHTDDIDYLIFDENNFKQFIFDKENNIDYMNGNGSNFAEAIYNKEKGNKIASAQSLFELKAFSLLSHVRNINPEKINSTIFDMNFLAQKFEININCPTLSKFATKMEIESIKKEIR